MTLWVAAGQAVSVVQQNMSTSKFRIKNPPDKAQAKTNRLATSDFIRLLGAPAQDLQEPGSADSIEDNDDEPTVFEAPVVSPRTPAVLGGRPAAPSPATGADIGKSAQRSFLSNISQDIVYQKPQERPAFQQGRHRGVQGSLTAQVSSLPVQAIGLAPENKRSFTISSTQSEAHLLKCLCTPMNTAEPSESVFVLLKASICRNLNTDLGAALTISAPWTEMPALPNCRPILIPWLVTNDV